MSADAELPAGAIRVPGTDRLFYRKKILVVLLALLAMTLMAISAINVALPSIESSIGASPTDLQWLLSGYALSFGMVLVASGRIGDVLGRSSAFVVGVALFTLGSLICALVDDPIWLNTARVLQGVGAGIASPQVNGMILQYFSGLERAKAFALFGLVVSASVAAAPMITGWLIGWLGPELGWRASFAWNVPIGIATVIAALRWLPFGSEHARKLERAAGTHTTRRIDLDPIGIVLLSMAVLCIMGPFLLKQAVWFSLLIAGAALLVTWVRWERWYQARGNEPMVDLGLFRYRSFTNGILVSGTQFLGGTSIFAVLALYLQSGLGASALAAGMIGVPNAIASAWSSMWSGDRVLQHGRRIIVGAFGIYIAGIVGCMVLAQFIDPAGAGLSFWWLALPLVACGLAIGAINSCNQTLSQVDIPPAVGGTAGAVKQVAERIGTAIGNTMITAVLFALVASSWTMAFTAAYGVIALIFVVALSFAVLDLRMLGDGGVPATARVP